MHWITRASATAISYSCYHGVCLQSSKENPNIQIQLQIRMIHWLPAPNDFVLPFMHKALVYHTLVMLIISYCTHNIWQLFAPRNALIKATAQQSTCACAELQACAQFPSLLERGVAHAHKSAYASCVFAEKLLPFSQGWWQP